MRQTYTLHINDHKLIFYSVYDLKVMIKNLDEERRRCLKDAYVTSNATKSLKYKAEDFLHDNHVSR
jgi:hypothetical protein